MGDNYILTTLFGNVVSPPQVMPRFLGVISYLIPQYYFFTSIRLTIIGWDITMVFPYLLNLFLIYMILLGYSIYSLGLKKAKREGSLSWF
ncbi:MAG: hypothetical protein AOA65_1080 [Candidatus Bathyarchaeota archaeon BA1]|nr:MAG: hypothetical protein AOA65_1080 [Candidatus Bathyarchaeota archaeon BA1]